jgi:hypothetical protein
MLKEAQGIGCKVQVLLPQSWLRLAPGTTTLHLLLLFPQFLRELLDEAIAIIRGAEAMPAHGAGSDW